MKKLNARNAFRAIVLSGLCLSSAHASAQSFKWEQVKELESAYSADVTPSGNLLLSDYLFDRTGGIYISTDKGATWEQTDVEDFNYSKFIHFDGYIFAAGAGTHIARSADNGRTWEVKSYKEAVEDVFGDYTDPTVCYAMAVHNGKLFVGDFCQGGVVYTEDHGETWKKTDLASMSYTYDDSDDGYAKGSHELAAPRLRAGKGDGKGDDGKPTTCAENVYQLVDFNGKLYACGIYFVFVLNDETMTWEMVRDDSNFMAVSTQFGDKLILGRSVVNETFSSPFLLTLDKDGKWGELQRPEGQRDNNVRALASDDRYIYAGLQMRGIYFTPNSGGTWFNISESLPYMTDADGEPKYYSPLAIVPADDFVYLAMYNYPGTEPGGLYRIDRLDLDELAATGISSTLPSDGGEKLQLRFDGHKVDFVAGDVPATVTVWDAAGRRVAEQAVRGTARIELAAPGVYTYYANHGGQVRTGKFLIK